MGPTSQHGGHAPALPASKRATILAVAARQFALLGYDQAKWADIAHELGLGQTGLYHYFASKAHCLLTIMAESLRDNRDYFDAVRRERTNVTEIIVEAVRHVFALDQAKLDAYVALQSEISLLSRDYVGDSEREQEQHAEARRYARDLNRAWTGFLEEAMRAGSVPRQDPYLLARSLLGLNSQPFQWYRPDSRIDLHDLCRSIEAHALALVFDSAGYLQTSRATSPSPSRRIAD